VAFSGTITARRPDSRQSYAASGIGGGAMGYRHLTRHIVAAALSIRSSELLPSQCRLPLALVRPKPRHATPNYQVRHGYGPAENLYPTTFSRITTGELAYRELWFGSEPCDCKTRLEACTLSGLIAERRLALIALQESGSRERATVRWTISVGRIRGQPNCTSDSKRRVLSRGQNVGNPMNAH
jgi:hypothetical protein